MTWPSEVKPREGDAPGTTFGQYEVGAKFPELYFTLTPDVVRDYSRAINADREGDLVEGQPLAVPSVLALYLMAVMYRRYPPAQGGVMAANTFRFHQSLPADRDTVIVADGRIEETYEKRGRRYVRYSARFMAAGTLIAEAENTSTFPV